MCSLLLLRIMVTDHTYELLSLNSAFSLADIPNCLNVFFFVATGCLLAYKMFAISVFYMKTYESLNEYLTKNI